MAELQCRQATPDDFGYVLVFDGTDKSPTSRPRPNPDRLLGKILAGDIYLAEAEGRVIGYLRMDYLWPENVPLLAWLYLIPRFRGTGAADTLRNFAYQTLREAGYTKLLRSACTQRPRMLEKLANTCTPAGTLNFGEQSIEHFFWYQLPSSGQGL